ncbi:conserved exported protein of unknown function [Petrocella atlantisensis]|uniref:SLH domain-containing protein n=1 Tax=Petrocella atlantisensis TaxID=2173034 RepID=A0A3P7PWA1_9FIRM|nr:S-layer homology domain-containing protein [Petrocella atlantisensis]VDN48027.1 conserved exported protein of unknown function [Petrocella atlantisensis]
MKKTFTVIGLLTTIILVVGLASNSVQAASYTDVSDKDWFKADLSHISAESRDILKGYPDGTFKPANPLQVDQFIKCLVVAAGHNILQNEEGYWAKNHIDKAIELGYVQPGDFDNYRRRINREEMATLVSRTIEDLETTGYTKSKEIEGSLMDSYMVEGKHKENVLKVYELGIITGYPDGTFKPEVTLTRAEGIAVIRRIIDKGARKPYTSKGTNYADHFKGGKLWVDPVKESDEKNIAADLNMIESDRVYFDKDGRGEHKDHLAVMIRYTEYGKQADQLKDLERLLKRRLSDDHVQTILDYIKHKDGWRTLLEEENKWYYMDSYEVVVVDDRQMKGSKFERSLEVTIQMWYR